MVDDETLEQRERGHPAVAGEVLDRARNRNRMREVHRFREEASDLELGIDAGMKPPVGLEQQPLAEHEYGVAALRAGRTHLSLPYRDVAAGELGKDACTHETYRSTCASDVLAGADGGGNRATKILVGKCICEYADTALLPNTGDSRILHRAHAFVGRIFPDQRQRKQVSLRLAGGTFGAGKRDQPIRRRFAPLSVID